MGSWAMGRGRWSGTSMSVSTVRPLSVAGSRALTASSLALLCAYVLHMCLCCNYLFSPSFCACSSCLAAPACGCCMLLVVGSVVTVHIRFWINRGAQRQLSERRLRPCPMRWGHSVRHIGGCLTKSMLCGLTPLWAQFMFSSSEVSFIVAHAGIIFRAVEGMTPSTCRSSTRFVACMRMSIRAHITRPPASRTYTIIGPMRRMRA
ncbi:hypothetical protein L227DRAFT_167675 [Lentinus tigrinus ALCF2SS1-6]|uniref:Uncharacterized protein n=1 Tax=Lentinus tigrinus ALCF2SS1-6 TaxID=1328759 RepID=A0A5C2S634_9APHY|nr:hypothetical protein L227DRAFT_167675 [Lentinus tigrinus ALCF2SS1-6]